MAGAWGEARQRGGGEGLAAIPSRRCGPLIPSHPASPCRPCAAPAQVKFVVLDEADQMLNVGFEKDVETILENVPEVRWAVTGL